MLFEVPPTPSLRIDLRYARADNFTGRALYAADAVPRLVRPAAEALRAAVRRLESQGYGLVLWDAHRPLSAQRAMWELVPDPRYVADPTAGGGRHTKGTAVDVTLFELGSGREVEMPTEFDDFSGAAHRGAACSAAARRGVAVLEAAMVGFEGLPSEWWHFDLCGWRAYPDVEG